MKKIIVRKNNEDKILEFIPIEQDVQLWEESKKLESKWMKSERIIPLTDATPEEIASAIETIPAVTQVIPAVPESVDSEGNVIPAQDERVEEVSPEMIKLPKTYEIIVTDISAEVQADKDKEDERKALRELLKNIQDTDIDTVAKLKSAMKKLIKVLL